MFITYGKEVLIWTFGDVFSISYSEADKMEFLEGQFHMAKNLLSYPTRVESSELNGLPDSVRRSLDVLALKMNGRTIPGISEKIVDGVEILIPVNREFESTGQYVCNLSFVRLSNIIDKRTNNFNLN